MNPPYATPSTSRTFRGASHTAAGSDIDPIVEITQIVRTLVFYYTETITQHNRAIETYNQNVATLLALLNNILEIQAARGRPPPPTAADFAPSRGSWNSIRRNRTSPAQTLDLSNLVYLLNFASDAQSARPMQNRSNTSASNDFSVLFNIPIGGGSATEEQRPIPLTLTEIAHATRILRYHEDMGERRCPISLDDFVENEEVCQIRGCRHFFKPQHLLRWLESHVECPVCRYDLRQHRTSTSTTETREPPVEIVNTPTTTTSETIRRNVSISEFVPILENILSNTPPDSATTTTTTPTNHITNLLGSRFSQVLSEMILEQMPTIDGSNNLLYTIEIPLSR